MDKSYVIHFRNKEQLIIPSVTFREIQIKLEKGMRPWQSWTINEGEDSEYRFIFNMEDVNYIIELSNSKVEEQK